ncbi:phosphomannomutase/phosphoglucomutase [Candidatus Marinimicrobia bacterium]|nr:phosphomannomutase/phosphoglucomutase [Candidatus Neomarinimicrobiota bacterium]
MLNPDIFREYDIRGNVEEDFPDHIVKKLGKAFGTIVKRAGGNEIAISGDIRITTPNLINCFKAGVTSTGVDIINLGILPTPVNYFSMFHLGVYAAVQITGSHNPPEYNGFKLSINKQPFFGEDIQSLYNIIKKMDFEEGEGTEARYKILNDYNQMIVDKIKIEKPLKVVMDCGNAAASINAPQIFSSLGIDLKKLYCEPDGTFPNHHPDPSVKENLEDLIREIKSGEYDFGIAFDGDGDRVGVVDENGKIIWSDQLISLFLPEIIKDGEDILYDVKCSKSLEDMIIRYGGNPIMWKTGHSLIKKKMSEINCKLGGEMSGHIFFADDYYGYDDATYVAARLAQLLSRTDKTLSELASEIPTYYSTPEIRLEAKNDTEKFRITNEAVNYFKNQYDCITIDGVRIKFRDGWGLVRASNTQPVIVCRFEASTEERKLEIQNLILNKLQEFGKLEQGTH